MASHPLCAFQSDPSNFNSEFVLDMLCDLSYAVQQVSGGSSASLVQINSDIQSIQNQINSLNSQLSSLNSQLNGLSSDKVDRVGGTSTGQTLNNATFTGSVTGLRKGMVQLSQVNNTSDLDKPVSTATQAALDLKADIDSPDLTGKPTAPTPIISSNDTRIATTEFVNKAIGVILDTSGVQLDTIKELANAINDNPVFYQSVSDVSGIAYDLSRNFWTGTGYLSSTYLTIANARDFSFNHPTAVTPDLSANNQLIPTTAWVKSIVPLLAGSGGRPGFTNGGATAPTTATAGSVGDLYFYTANGGNKYISVCIRTKTDTVTSQWVTLNVQTTVGL